MGGYIGASAGGVANAAERKQTYSITTATTSLTGLAYTPTKVHVFHNGVRLVDGTDYTATNGTSITLTNAAQNGDEVVVISYPSFQTSDTVSAANGGTFAGNVTFSGEATFSSDLNAGTIKDAASTNTAMTIDSSGRISRSVIPYIYLRGTVAGEATSHGTTETYTDWAIDGSALGGMTWNSSNGRITVPIDGIYLIAAKFYFWINNAAEHGVMAQKNGTTFQEYFTDLADIGNAGRTDHTVTVSEALKLNANDYISFSCSGDIYGGSNHTNCQMVMIG